MKYKIFPSLIAESQSQLNERFEKVKSISNTFQFDVMDGKFVENESLNFDFEVPKTIIPKRFEAHLMVNNPEEWVNKNYQKVHTIIFHIEPLFRNKNSVEEINRIIKNVKDKKKLVGIAINPETSVKDVKNFLNKIDKFLVLSVNPGNYGANFIPETLKKIRKIRDLKPELDIEIDGGIDEKTIKFAKDAGANNFVVGSYLQNAKDSKTAVKKLKRFL